MIQWRNTEVAQTADERPLTARSVIASTLLGTSPPRLPGWLLVRAGALFGIAEGTVRTALSRMVAAGELTADDGTYALAGPLLARQARQDESRRAAVVAADWDGAWTMAVVHGDPRSAAQRSELRAAAGALRLAELREGVWVRPDNLDPDRLPASSAVLATQCARLTVHPDEPGPEDLASRLWELDGWAARAAALRARMDGIVVALEAGDTAALAPGFVLSASVLRLTQADPLLPDALLPAAWPGAALRAEYDRYDAAYQSLLRAWFRAQR
ncbi:MAG TPA: PaaX family transcriptional regulator C-terminal domain-containing protein [Acidimicrobiales bacterium]|nr:PaaX family transcriptional regulator C-terminal domain-containing protein [Acidimicrobiales bacterium]